VDEEDGAATVFVPSTDGAEVGKICCHAERGNGFGSGCGDGVATSSKLELDPPPGAPGALADVGVAVDTFNATTSPPSPSSFSFDSAISVCRDAILACK
jgi:hypothetical protein